MLANINNLPKWFFIKIQYWALKRHFDKVFYLECHPDVKQSGMDPLFHYIRYGKKEGRDIRLNYRNNNQQKYLYLHLGLHKTATTSIQMSLHQNENKLQKKGYYYLKSKTINHSFSFYNLFSHTPWKHTENVIHKRSKEEIEQTWKNVKTNFEIQLKYHQHQHIIISGEDINTLTKSELNDIKLFLCNTLPNHIVKIVVSVRNPINYYTSINQQVIKHGNVGNINYNFNEVRNKLQKMIDVFGKQNLIVFAFEKACRYKHGPVGYFLKDINYPTNKIKQIVQAKTNESLSFQSAEVIQYINHLCPIISKGTASPFRTRNDTLPFRNISGTKYFLDTNNQLKIIKDREDTLLWIHNNFGIDYTNVKPSPSKKIRYDKQYIDQFMEAYALVNVSIQHLAHQFIVHKLTLVNDEADKMVFTEIEQHIHAKFPKSVETPSNFPQEIRNTI